MKLLILSCLLGIAAASFLQEAAPVIDNAVLSFLYGTTKAGSLSAALGTTDPIFDQIEDDVKTELGKALKDAFLHLLEKMKEHVDLGKNTSKEMLEKVKDIHQKLKDLHLDLGDKIEGVLAKIKEKASDLLKSILEKLGFGKRNLDDQMDHVARMKFSDFIQQIKEKLLENETIQKIRDYIKRLVTNNPLIVELQKLVEKLRDVDIREILRHLLEHKPGRQVRAMGETWDKIKNFFKELNIKIEEKHEKFGEWIKDMWDKGLDKLKNKYTAIKAIAIEFIANAKDLSVEMAKEALEFFQPYKDDLGTLWDQMVDATKQVIGKF